MRGSAKQTGNVMTQIISYEVLPWLIIKRLIAFTEIESNEGIQQGKGC